MKNGIQIIQGNCMDVLKGMDNESVDMCMTSPPYWGLRDYGTNGQLGLEPTYQEYIAKLVAIFDEVKRVLKSSGTCWVNLGDTYGGSGGYGNNTGITHSLTGLKQRIDGSKKQKARTINPKSLLGIPERFAIAMTDSGWIRRNTIIWYKPSCMPSSATDRFTVDFEYLYFFTKSTRYYFEQQFQPYANSSFSRYKYSHADANVSEDKRKNGWCTTKNREERKIVGMRPEGSNKRCVWTINSQAYSGAHFATYPEELVATPIKAGCPKGGTVLDPFMGSGTTLKVARDLGRNGIGIELNHEYIKLAENRINLKQKIFGLS